MARIYVADKPTLDKIARAVGVESDNKIYGIKINKKDSNPDTRCTYLGDAVGMSPAYMNFETGEFNYGDWADVWFVKGNFPCMLNTNGSIEYKLDPNDYSLTEYGNASDIADTSSSLNAMSAMPLVWIWQYEIGDFKYIYIANYKVNDNYHAYAHQREDGSIAPYVFMSMFKGSLTTTTGSSVLRSLSGLPVHAEVTFADFVTYAQANGSAWNIKTWSQRNLMQCLLTMMFCSTDSQAKLGYGNMAKTSTLKTGTLNDKGQFWGGDTVSQVKAFHQEAVWGDQWDSIAGLIYEAGVFRVKMTAPYSLDGADYTKLAGVTLSGSSIGYINDTLMTEFGGIPSNNEGSDSTYECDEVYFQNVYQHYARVGGSFSDATRCGLFALHIADGNAATYPQIGASLSCLP